jgi:hypothetical protein
VDKFILLMRKLAAKGECNFEVKGRIEPAFETWWREKCNQKLTGKALAKSAWNEALRQMGAFD